MATPSHGPASHPRGDDEVRKTAPLTGAGHDELSEDEMEKVAGGEGDWGTEPPPPPPPGE